MKFFCGLIIILFCLCTVSAQVENSLKTENTPVRAKFYEDFLNFYPGNSDTTRLDVFIQVPYTEVQFVKSNLGFSANYTITISVFNEDKEKLLTEKIWSEKIDSKDFDQTISKNNFNLSLRSFYLLPAKYFIRSSVEDRESKKSFAAENIVVVRDFSAKPSIGDIMLISRLTSAEDSTLNNVVRTNKILPNISKNVSSQRDGIPFFYEIYSDSSTQIKLKYEILNSDENSVFTKDTVQQIDSGKTRIFYTISNLDLGLGNYKLKISLDRLDNKELTTVSKSFVSRWIGVPSVIKDLDKAIDELVYIASSDDISHIKQAETQEEKIKRYLEYWKKKDPTPDSESNPIFDEYYRRIAYANENFSHYIEGWRTDRGMVFIILGAPNNVDRHPFDYDAKPYEIWEYYELNKQFVFMDETGFGDYRLITPLYGDFYRYR